MSNISPAVRSCRPRRKKNLFQERAKLATEKVTKKTTPTLMIYFEHHPHLAQNYLCAGTTARQRLIGDSTPGSDCPMSHGRVCNEVYSFSSSLDGSSQEKRPRYQQSSSPATN